MTWWLTSNSTSNMPITRHGQVYTLVLAPRANCNKMVTFVKSVIKNSIVRYVCITLVVTGVMTLPLWSVMTGQSSPVLILHCPKTCRSDPWRIRWKQILPGVDLVVSTRSPCLADPNMDLTVVGSEERGRESLLFKLCKNCWEIYKSNRTTGKSTYTIQPQTVN